MSQPKVIIERYLAGKEILREGQSSNRAYVIIRGFVEVYKNLGGGKFVSLAKLGKGQMFGEMSLFGNKKCSASVRALTNLEVQIIDKSVFEDYLKQTPPLIKILLEILVERLNQMSQKYMISSQVQNKRERFTADNKPAQANADQGKATQ